MLHIKYPNVLRLHVELSQIRHEGRDTMEENFLHLSYTGKEGERGGERR